MPWVSLKQRMNRLLSWKPTVCEISSTKIPEDSRIVLGFSLRAGSLFCTFRDERLSYVYETAQA